MGRLLHKIGKAGSGRVRRAWQAVADGIAASGRRRLWEVDGETGPAMSAMASAVCHLGGWLRDLSGLPSWYVRGDDDVVVYLGERRRLEVLAPVLGHRPEQVSPGGRIALAGLDGRIRRWHEEGVALVICELARRQPLAPRGAGSVAVHEWVDLRLAIDRPVEELLSGPRFRGVRPRLNRARRDGIVWRLSHDPADLRSFYHTMYVPTVRARHGTRVQLTPLATQHEWWFRRHGLLLVEQDGVAIGGSLLHRRGNVAYGVESGVLNGDDELYQRGLGTVLVYACLEWAHAQGAAYLDMGGSRPWFADGSLRYKLGWGAAVSPRPLPSREWTFCVGPVSSALASRINGAGLLAETTSGLRRVVLGDAVTAVDGEPQPAFAPGVGGLVVVPRAAATATKGTEKGAQVGQPSRRSRAGATEQSVT